MMDITIVVPVIVGLIEVCKRVGLDTKYAPLLSVLMGMIFFASAQGFNFDAIFVGIIAGLSSCGLYSAGKSIADHLSPKS